MSIYSILQLIGALGFFIFGMKIMSEGIQKVAGNKMRNILSVMTTNRFTGVLTGFLITSLVQSSSATTVMIVSFVNAGLLKLKQAVGVIMGANIGTTITAVLITTFGFSKLSISAYALPIIAVGFPLTFFKNNKAKSWGEFLIGFALLFLGLDYLKQSVPGLDAGVFHWLQDLTDYGILSTLIFIAFGSILTIVVQSSSAAMALTLVMCEQGWIPFEMAAAIVLGENIGTTVTANLAAIIGNVHAKRAARAHFIFNVFGVFWMLFVFQWYLGGIDKIMLNTEVGSPYINISSIKWSLTIFHISFNIINTLILIWFVPQIVKIVKRMVLPKDELDEEHHLEFIGTGLMKTFELSIFEGQKEIAKFGKITLKMSGFFKSLIFNNNEKSKQLEKIKKYEEITDRIDIEIVKYLSKVAEGRLSKTASDRIRTLLSISNELERIGDIFFQMSKTYERMMEDKLEFSSEQKKNLQEMFILIDEALMVMHNNLKSDYSTVKYEEAKQKEENINAMRNSLRKKHLDQLEMDEESIKTGMMYNDIFSSCEKIGDHAINITEAILEETSITLHH